MMMADLPMGAITGGFILPAVLMVLGLAWASTWWFRSSCSARRVLPRFATAGEVFSYPVIVSNAGARSQTGLALLENVAGTEPSFDEWLAVQTAEEARMRSFRFSSRGRAAPFRAASDGRARLSERPAMLSPPARSPACLHSTCGRPSLHGTGAGRARGDRWRAGRPG